MKKIFLLLLLFCSQVWATSFTDLKFGQAQIADSQWNVSACTQTATCQIYSKNPGTAYKIPWTSGQLQWASGDYVAFAATGNSSNPWNAIQYAANGTQKAVMGTGHVINMGADYFFFVGNDNNTGQLFSMTSGLVGSAGVSWTGTLNPTISQVDTYAANGSTTPLAPGETAAPPGPPPLCCGASADPFNAYSTHVTRVTSFANRTTVDSQVNITQIGNNTTITVDQSGTRNNHVDIGSTGSNNNITVNQSGNSSTVANYSETWVTGNNNTISTTQQSTGGAKGSFITVNDNNNSVLLQQKDNGSHYASVNLSGGNKNVDILQQGSASNMASVTLTGLPVDLSLSQTGSTQNFYSITFNCATTGGCPKIAVQQGK